MRKKLEPDRPRAARLESKPDHDPASPAAENEKPAAADETRTAGTSPVERSRITDAAMALAKSDWDLIPPLPRKASAGRGLIIAFGRRRAPRRSNRASPRKTESAP